MKSKLESKPFVNEVSEVDLKHLKLDDVLLTNCVLGYGSFGKVYKARHYRTSCAVKKLNLKLHQQVIPTLVERIKQNFLLECLQHSKLSHPNIVKMFGVFYPKNCAILPVLVMELMEYNLTQLLERSRIIPMYVKLSILQDVSRGLCYLHAQNPPIVHQALYSDNILFTKGLTAKIANFRTGAKIVSDQVLLGPKKKDWYYSDHDFLPLPRKALKYELPLNVYSFGCVVCHVITGRWPKVNVSDGFLMFSHSDPIDSVPRKKYYDHLEIVDDWYYTIHQAHVMTADYTYLLKCLAQACLQHDPNDRPHMSQVYERITSIMTGEPEFIILYNVYSYVSSIL